MKKKIVIYITCLCFIVICIILLFMTFAYRTTVGLMSISDVVKRDGKIYFIIPEELGNAEILTPRGFLSNSVLNNIIIDKDYYYIMGYKTNFWGYSKLFLFDPEDIVDNRSKVTQAANMQPVLFDYVLFGTIDKIFLSALLLP